jgi:F-type H+-transporting ATPase subunit a
MFLLAASPEDHVKDLILIGSPEFPVLTMHMVTLVVAALLTWLLMRAAAKGIETGPPELGNDRYLTKGRFAQMVEVVSIYLRDQMLVPVLGEQATRRYMPFLLTIFFFILINNLLGMVPLVDLQHALHLDAVTGGRTWLGGTPTSNIAITAVLASFSLLLIQIHAFRELGLKGWLVHHCGGLVPGPIALAPVVVVVFVVEVLGDIIKPTALAIRLFANMVAGHILLAVLLSFGGMAQAAGLGFGGVASISVLSGIFALLISFLELFIAFLQAFIFMFLTAVFVSLLSHHEEHEHAHEEHPQSDFMHEEPAGKPLTEPAAA